MHGDVIVHHPAEKRFLFSSDVDWTLSLSFIRNATCYLVCVQCNPALNLSTFEAKAQPLCRFAEPVTALNPQTIATRPVEQRFCYVTAPGSQAQRFW